MSLWNDKTAGSTGFGQAAEEGGIVKGQITAVETGGVEQPQWGKLLVSCGSAVLFFQSSQMLISHNQLPSLSCRTPISSCNGVAMDITAAPLLPIQGIRIREVKCMESEKLVNCHQPSLPLYIPLYMALGKSLTA